MVAAALAITLVMGLVVLGAAGVVIVHLVLAIVVKTRVVEVLAAAGVAGARDDTDVVVFVILDAVAGRCRCVAEAAWLLSMSSCLLF